MAHEPDALRLDPPTAAPPVPTSFDVTVFHDGIPRIRPQELRIVGRVVSFDAETETCGEKKTFVFKGWVAHITRDTVTLLDVVRYADANELAAHTRDGATPAEIERFPLVLHTQAQAPSPLPGGAVLPVPREGAFGRMPYVTFARRKIRNVKFEADTPLRAADRSNDDFLSRERAPLWYSHDLQKVRMLVRRYLVHTAQGNNAQQLSLAAFLSTRLSWAPPDCTVLEAVALEELKDLMATDESISERAQQQQQHRANAAGGAVDAALNTTAAQRYRVQSATLNRTNVPSRTTYVAIVSFAVGIALLLYTATVYTTTNVAVLLEVIRTTLALCAGCGAVMVLSAVVTGLSVVRTTFPVSCKKMFWRSFLSLVALGIAGYAVFVCASLMFRYRQLDGTHLYAFYVDQVATARDDVCDMFKDYECSGFTHLCSSSSSGFDEACPTPVCTTSYSVVCKPILEDKIAAKLLPYFIMVLASVVLVLLDVLLGVRLRYHAARIERRLA